MTTYSHTITLDDSQRSALEAALILMIKHCDEQMKDGPKAPYWSQKKCCQEMWSDLMLSVPQMTSTSSFCR